MKIQQNIISQLTDLNNYSDAMINILQGYCENYLENPSQGCLFDILAGLNYLKQNSNEVSKLIEDFDNYY